MPVRAIDHGVIASSGGGAAAFIAFGGNITQYETGGTTYRVHTFRGSGKFVVSSGETDVNYMVLGGGAGGGAGNPGAGGGAGGIQSGTTTVTGGDVHTVTVGRGGRSGWYTYGPYGDDPHKRKGEDGHDSAFNGNMRGVEPRNRSNNYLWPGRGRPTYSESTIGSTDVRQLEFYGLSSLDHGYALTQGLGSDYTAVSDWTIAAWVYMDAHNTDSIPASYIVDLRGNTAAASNYSGPYFNIYDVGTGQVKAGSNAAEATWSNVSFSTGAWTHFVITKTGSTYELWMNNSSKGTQTAATGDANFNASGGTLGNAALNANASYNAFWFNGKMAEVAVWKTKLDSSNITKVYNSGNPFDLTSNSGNYDESANLIGYFIGLGNDKHSDGGGGGGGLGTEGLGRPGGSGGGSAVWGNETYGSSGALTNVGASASGGGTGNAGGDAVLSTHTGWEYACAGGGGGGADGGDAHGGTGGDSNTGADGGAGLTGQMGISAATVTYAGGGAGSDYPYSTQNLGGSGLGGKSTKTTNGPGFGANASNAGSGSGGGHYSAEADGAARLGSGGIVIIRYEVV